MDLFNQANESLLVENLTTSGYQKKQINFFHSSASTQRPALRSVMSKSSLYMMRQQHAITTPSVQKLCKQFDDDLAKLLNDIEFNSTSQADSESSEDDDIALKNSHLKENLTAFTTNMYESFLDLFTNTLKKSIGDDEATIKKILFVCRLIHALPYTCPNLKACFYSLCSPTNSTTSLIAITSKVKSAKSFIDSKVFFLHKYNTIPRYQKILGSLIKHESFF